LLCIAGDFTKYDEHAVQQIDRSIELIRYRRYGDNLMLFELVNATATTGEVGDGEALKAFLIAIGSDVQVKQLKFYVAFRRLNNFACVEVRPKDGQMLVYAKVDPATMVLEKDFTRDVSNIGHFGTGNLEIRITSDEDLEKAKPLLLKSYEAS
jgi:predicted transport protein